MSIERSQDAETIDGNGIYKHMKKLHSEREFRQRFARLDYMKLTEKQMEAFNTPQKFLSVRAGNRSGKTEFAAIYSTCAMLDRWPRWYEGYQFVRPPIARSTTFDCWFIGPTGVNVRDVQQAKLVGGLT